jgi:hypothetical protein
MNDKEAYSFTVTQAESHLARIYVEAGATVRVQLSTPEGSPISLFMCIRIGVAAFFPVQWESV